MKLAVTTLNPSGQSVGSSYIETAENIRQALCNIGKGSGHLTDNLDSADVILLVEHIDYKPPSYFNNLLEAKPIKKHLKKILTINTEDAPSGFLNGFYCSLSSQKFEKNRHVAIPYPKLPDLCRTKADFKEFKYLASFRGTRTAKVRDAIFKTLDTPSINISEIPIERFFRHTEEQKREYVDEIMSSKFVLCPRGFSTSSYRLYETMQLSRAPVILSDDWVAPDGPEWDEFSLRIAEHHVENILSTLEKKEDETYRMHSKARQAWENHCTTAAICRQIISHLPRLLAKNKEQLIRIKRHKHRESLRSILRRFRSLLNCHKHTDIL